MEIMRRKYDLMVGVSKFVFNKKKLTSVTFLKFTLDII